MSLADTAAVAITDGPAITTTAGWRLPHAINLAARHLGPPPWPPGQLAACIYTNLATGQVAASLELTAPVGLALTRQGDPDWDTILERVAVADAVSAAIGQAHLHHQVHWTLPDRVWTWPPLHVDCTTGDVQVMLPAGRVPVGQAAGLPGRWVELAARHGIVKTGDGWTRAA